MNADFFNALDLLEREKGIPKEYMIEKIEAALANACRKEVGPTAEVRVQLEPTKNDFRVFWKRTVVADGEVTDPKCEIGLSDAKAMSRRHKLGGVVEVDGLTARTLVQIGISVALPLLNAIGDGRRFGSVIPGLIPCACAEGVDRSEIGYRRFFRRRLGGVQIDVISTCISVQIHRPDNVKYASVTVGQRATGITSRLGVIGANLSYSLIGVCCADISEIYPVATCALVKVYGNVTVRAPLEESLYSLFCTEYTI